MTQFRFPDNTVLCNFASVDRLDLLGSVLGERGRWTEAVAFETSRSTRAWPALANVANHICLGEPLEVHSDDEMQAIDRIRRAVFGGTDEAPLKHLGEAQTCFVILNRSEYAGSWWISDDQEALRFARFQGITTRETIDLIGEAVVTGEIAPALAFDLLQAMADRGRCLRLPASVSDLRR